MMMMRPLALLALRPAQVRPLHAKMVFPKRDPTMRRPTSVGRV